MKKTLTIIGLALIAASTLQAGNFYLSVEPGKTSRDSEKLWKADNGSYRKNYTETKVIDITVRNNDRSYQTCTVEWYFVAEPLEGKDEYIYDSGKTVLNLAGGKEKELQIESTEVKGKELNAEFFNVKAKKGGKYDGYLVRVVVDGEAVKTVCSKKTRGYEEKVLELVKELEEAKKKKTPKDEEEAEEREAPKLPRHRSGRRKI